MNPDHIFPPYFPKVKLSLSLSLTEHPAMKAYWGIGSIALLIL